MTPLIFALISLIILIPVIYIVPLGFTTKGKHIIVGTSLIVALLSILMNFTFDWWQSLLVFALLVVLFTLVIKRRFGDSLYLEPDNLFENANFKNSESEDDLSLDTDLERVAITAEPQSELGPNHEEQLKEVVTEEVKESGTIDSDIDDDLAKLFGESEHELDDTEKKSELNQDKELEFIEEQNFENDGKIDTLQSHQLEQLFDVDEVDHDELVSDNETNHEDQVFYDDEEHYQDVDSDVEELARENLTNADQDIQRELISTDDGVEEQKILVDNKTVSRESISDSDELDFIDELGQIDTLVQDELTKTELNAFDEVAVTTEESNVDEEFLKPSDYLADLEKIILGDSDEEAVFDGEIEETPKRERIEHDELQGSSTTAEQVQEIKITDQLQKSERDAQTQQAATIEQTVKTEIEQTMPIIEPINTDDINIVDQTSNLNHTEQLTEPASEDYFDNQNNVDQVKHISDEKASKAEENFGEDSDGDLIIPFTEEELLNKRRQKTDDNSSSE